jgi:RNA polymerase sigma factor for flagellar operon FliA
MDKNKQELWAKYAKSRTDENRNLLVSAYYPMAERLAEKMRAGLPDSVDVDDLKQEAAIGLMQAIGALDPAKIGAFSTFAPLRIRGAMLDFLRDNDHLPRVSRNRHNQYLEAKAKLLARTGQQPTPEEIAEEMGLDPFSAKFAAILASDCTAKIRQEMSQGEADAIQHGESQAKRMFSSLPSLNQNIAGPDADPSVIESEEWWQNVMAGFSAAEQEIITVFYRDGGTMRECAQRVGKSQSRVSQMFKRIHSRLMDRGLSSERAFDRLHECVSLN